MNNDIQNIIIKLKNLERYKKYYNDIDNKYYIDIECAMYPFDSKEDAEKAIDKLMYINIISLVAEVLKLDYIFNDNNINIKII